jgi:hypothetical protein
VEEHVRRTHIEPRWPVVLAILGMLIILAELPQRIRLVPAWAPYVVCFIALAPIAAVALSSGKAFWLRVERRITLCFCVVTGVSTVVNLVNLFDYMVHRSNEISGLQLLASSVAMWVSNLLAFSLLYWQIDRGGPDARANESSKRPDWLFPQQEAPAEDVPFAWRPTFVDYLFLAYCTSTAFSPTGLLPLTPRAKVLMMLQSTISLVTIVLVASRAINILGSPALD